MNNTFRESNNTLDPWHSIDGIDIFTMTSASLLGLVIIITNSITLTAIIKVEILWEKYAILVGSYCVADILVGITIIIYTAKKLFLNIMIQGIECEWHKLLVYDIEVISVCVTQLHGVAMTIDRFVAIQYPLTYHQKMTPERLKMIIASIWILGIMLLVVEPILHGFSCAELETNYRQYFQLLFTCLLLILNSILYIKIWFIVRKKKHTMVHSFITGQNNTTKNNIHIDKATKMVFIVIVVTVLMQFPYIILYMFSGRNKMDVYQSIAAMIYVSNALVNNFVYYFVNEDFKYAFKKILCKPRM